MMNKWFRFWAICVLLTIVLGSASSANAQNETVQYGKENLSRDYLTKYTITVNSDAEGSTMFLYDCYFGKWHLLDSAVVKNGKAVISGKCPAKSKNDVHSLFPKGWYRVECTTQWTIHSEPVDVSDISVDGDSGSEKDSIPAASSTASSSDESFDFTFDFDLVLNQQNSVELNFFKQQFSVVNSEENKVEASIQKMFVEKDDVVAGMEYAAELTSSMPHSCLGQYYHLNNEIVQTMRRARYAFADLKPYVFHRIISQADFTDPRLCHSTSMLFPFIREYLTYRNRLGVDQIITEVDTILLRAARGGRYQCALYAEWLFGIFSRLDDPYYEPVLLHIYDTYDRGWISEDKERRIKRQMDRIRRLAPGAQIPELTAYDIDGKQHSTNEIKTKYTVLWFWDPDCDHCQEMTPILHDLYQEKADELNFEVFAVEVNDDYDRWTAFSEKHHLDDWINLSTSMGETSVDYIEYFDIVTTPVILLIDNEANHTIIARQATLEEIVGKMKN